MSIFDRLPALSPTLDAPCPLCRDGLVYGVPDLLEHAFDHHDIDEVRRWLDDKSPGLAAAIDAALDDLDPPELVRFDFDAAHGDWSWTCLLCYGIGHTFRSHLTADADYRQHACPTDEVPC